MLHFDLRGVLPEAGIKGRDKWLHHIDSLRCDYLSLLLIHTSAQHSWCYTYCSMLFLFTGAEKKNATIPMPVRWTWRAWVNKWLEFHRIIWKNHNESTTKSCACWHNWCGIGPATGTDACLNNMMTSSNRNIFCVTGLLCAEFTGHRSPLNSPHKGQWRGPLIFSLIYTWINGRENNIEAVHLGRHRTHYDVIVM